MKPAPFEYRAPESLSSALEIMAEYGDDGKLLAGGQSLIPAMNFRLIQPTLIVDLNRITELDYIKANSNGGLSIGALTRQRRFERNPLVISRSPLIQEAIQHVAHPQIRNRGTIGGSLVHADPAAELPVIMVALDGRFQARSQNGDRWIAAADFFKGIFTTTLNPNEILVEIEVPPLEIGTGWSFVEFARRKGDYALLGVAAVIRLDEQGNCQHAKMVYLNAGDMPIQATKAVTALINEKPSREVFEAAAELATSEISPTGNIHASVPYLRHLSRVLAVRALTEASNRASNLPPNAST